MISWSELNEAIRPQCGAQSTWNQLIPLPFKLQSPIASLLPSYFYPITEDQHIYLNLKMFYADTEVHPYQNTSLARVKNEVKKKNIVMSENTVLSLC